MSQAVYTVYDIETTGLSAACQCEIIEFAGIKLDENLKEVDRMHVYIQPYKKLPKKIIELTGITNEMLRGSENRFQMLPKIRRFIGDTISVCHNAQFDFSFISTMCLQQGLPVLHDYICTMKSYKAITGEKSAKLYMACERFGIKLVNAHTAIADVEATVQLFRELCGYDNGLGKKQLYHKETNDQELFMQLMGPICSQNPNKKIREFLCKDSSGKKVNQNGARFSVSVQNIINLFEAGYDPCRIAEDLKIDHKYVSDIFALWLNNKRMPRFIYLEEQQINRQVRSMINHSMTIDRLIEMHKKLYETDNVNYGAYQYFWIKNRSISEQMIERGLQLLFINEYPIDKIVEVFPHIYPCDITLAFRTFALDNKETKREYIANSLCNKGELDRAMIEQYGHFSNEQIQENPELIKTAITCALFDEGFFAVKKS